MRSHRQKIFLIKNALRKVSPKVSPNWGKTAFLATSPPRKISAVKLRKYKKKPDVFTSGLGWGGEICKEVKALPLRRNTSLRSVAFGLRPRLRAIVRQRKFKFLSDILPQSRHSRKSRNDDEGEKLCAVGTANEKTTSFEIVFPFALAGVERFELPNDGVRVRSLTAWRHPNIQLARLYPLQVYILLQVGVILQAF